MVSMICFVADLETFYEFGHSLLFPQNIKTTVSKFDAKMVPAPVRAEPFLSHRGTINQEDSSRANLPKQKNILKE